MTATERLIQAFHPRNPETQRLLAQAAARLAAQLDADTFALLVDAAEHPTGVGTDEVVSRSGATLRQINYWTEMGYLTVEEKGTGHLRHYPPGQLSKALLLHRLVNLLGMHPLQASYAADQLLDKGHARVPGLELTRRTR